MLTPGGHRRFARTDIEALAQRRLHAKPGAPSAPAEREQTRVGQIWAERALQRTRREITEHPREHWMTSFDDEDRESSRKMGQRLMGLTMQYVASADGGEDILAEAREIGHAYGLKAVEHGLPLRDALHAALFFRDALVETAIELPVTAQVRPQANRRLLRRINAVLNAVQIAVAEVYDPH